VVSPARRRACVEHVVRELGVSERKACAVLGQHRSTQRKAPRGSDDEAALTADIIELAKRYGRYGYRRITALLRDAGWVVNRKRVERVWRREGLKVPQRQPKRGRLWLADGSCVRLRPERANHVWAYDFVEDRTREGRKFRMLCVVDEFTREALAIRVARKLTSTEAIDTLADLFIARGAPAHTPLGPGAGVRGRGGERLDRRCRVADGLHRESQPVGERLRGELQREASRRAAERRGVQHATRGAGADRGMASSLQSGPAALVLGVPSTRTRDSAGGQVTKQLRSRPGR